MFGFKFAWLQPLLYTSKISVFSRMYCAKQTRCLINTSKGADVLEKVRNHKEGKNRSPGEVVFLKQLLKE